MAQHGGQQPRQGIPAAAAHLGAGIPDLGALKMPSPEMVAGALAHVELELGLRCQGCTRRIGGGFRFTRIGTTPQGIQMQSAVACMREDCDHAETLRQGATVVEMVGEYAWCDELGLDAPPLEQEAGGESAAEVVEQDERPSAASAASDGGAAGGDALNR